MPVLTQALIAVVHESAIGPKRTSPVAPHMSAFGGKADMTLCRNPLSRSLLGVKRTWLVAAHLSAFDPKRTWRLQCKMSANDPKRTLCSQGTLGCAQLLMCGSSCRTTFSNELWISIWPL